MSSYSNNQCSCSQNYTSINGNSIDIDVDYCNPEIRADIVVSEYSSVRLWGRVVNCDGEPIENALVKLVKINCSCHKNSYIGVAHTITDCDGFYQFDLCQDDELSRYKILVAKATYGPEKTIPVEYNNCNPCCEDNICDSSNTCYEDNTCYNYNTCYNCCHYDECSHYGKCYEDKNDDCHHNKKYSNISSGWCKNTRY